MYSHAVRITLPIADFQDTIALWSDRCHALIAYQHDADEEISQTHVHLALMGCEVKAEALKRMWPNAPGKGNAFWSWKEMSLTLSDLENEHDTNAYILETDYKYMVYMTKGVLQPVFVKNVSNTFSEKCRSLWTPPPAPNIDDSPTQFYISHLYDKFIHKYPTRQSYDQYVHNEWEEQAGTLPAWEHHLLQNVRTTTFRYLYHRNDTAPHSSLYKIVASSTYLRIMENYGKLDSAILNIQNLWY